MRRASAALLALALITLAWPAPAEATVFRGRPYTRAAYRPAYPANHMPGWDWWRIYPYSPYNYGRNPYNPIILPYPYPYPYPYVLPQPYPVYVPSYGTASSGLPVPAVPPVPPVPTLTQTGTGKTK